METDVQEVKAVATALGLRSKAELAPICGVSANAPYVWGKKLPPKHRPKILAYARDNGVTLPRSFLVEWGVEPPQRFVAGNGQDAA